MSPAIRNRRQLGKVEKTLSDSLIYVNCEHIHSLHSLINHNTHNFGVGDRRRKVILLTLALHQDRLFHCFYHSRALLATITTTIAINISLELIPTSHDKDETAASNSFEGDNRAAICRPIDDIGNGQRGREEGGKEERLQQHSATTQCPKDIV